ncbi:MAG: GNAT family N-acetyltransferase [Anaerolineae bacterium]|nr:GNAT family N-acetyltransferase [Anaerolineae bacterium]
MRKELKNGLILRSLSEGIASDAERLPIHYRDVFKGEGEEFAERLIPWTHDLIERHPTTTKDDIWVVVDPAADDKVVSAVLLIPQVWRYGDVLLPVGQIELVATDKNYRRRGLIRELIAVAHERCAELGHVMTVIAGIPNYYRQFGYGMTVDLGTNQVVPFKATPPLKEGDEPEFTLKRATVDDIPILMQLDDYHAHHFTNLSVVYTEAEWRYEIAGKHKDSPWSHIILLIMNKEDEPVGYIAIPMTMSSDRRIAVFTYVVGEKSSYLATFVDVIRGLETFAAENWPEQDLYGVSFSSGVPEAVDAVANHMFSVAVWKYTYAFYIRVPDYVELLQRIKPLLESRLAGSAANGYTGELTIGFYTRQYLKLVFEKGKIAAIEMLDAEDDFHPNAQFPYDMFHSVVMGCRTVDDIRYMHADMGFNSAAKTLFDIMFPLKRPTISMTG